MLSLDFTIYIYLYLIEFSWENLQVRYKTNEFVKFITPLKHRKYSASIQLRQFFFFAKLSAAIQRKTNNALMNIIIIYNKNAVAPAAIIK